MQRRIVLLSSLAFVASAVASTQLSRTHETAADDSLRRATHTIAITLKCETQSGWVNDSSLHAMRGDTIVFALTPDSDVRDFVVTPKPRLGILPGRWLFRSRQHEGARGRPAVGNDMKPDAEGLYSYKVIGICPGGPPAKIDPDIIIDLG